VRTVGGRSPRTPAPYRPRPEGHLAGLRTVRTVRTVEPAVPRPARRRGSWDPSSANSLFPPREVLPSATIKRRKGLRAISFATGVGSRGLQRTAEDFRRRLELCQKAGVYFDRTRECAWLFHERLQSVYTELGDEAAAAREAKRMAEILADQETSRSGAPPR
jgi:hypothetical protein